MTNLSPQAQAVLIACNTAVERLPLTAKPEQFSIALIAAALRAAVAEVRTNPELKRHHAAVISEVLVLDKLVTIANELEGANV